jgi:hypothetical protein
VFLNLGLNAIQAMPDGGTLEILTTRRRRSRLGYGQFAEIRFRDTGVGIQRDKLKKLFIPFYTTKTKGTGLGLAISQRIVSQHGGTIEVRSTVGQGSTFSVFLPAMADPARPGLDPRTTTAEIQLARGDRTPSSVVYVSDSQTPALDSDPPSAGGPDPKPSESAKLPKTGVG